MADYSWQVTGQAPDQQINQNGDIVNGKLVTFTVNPQGYTGTIFIPDVIYGNIDATREMIQREVDNIVAVHQLSG
jgi:hypothetical protein